jgi:transcriptional antiterminator NusG
MSKQWYILRVGTNREDKVAKNLWSRARSNDLTEKVSRLLVVKEKVTEIKNGQRRTVERKVYPGYVMAEIETGEDGSIPPEVWHLIRETPGQIKFVSTQSDKPDRPTPMGPDEVTKMLQQAQRVDQEQPQVNVDFEKGEHVRVKEGSFENFEGTVEEVHPEKGMVKVTVMVFGRPTPIDFEYWKVEKAEQ